MIRHNHVGADHPAIGLVPRAQERLMHNWVGEVLFALPRTDGCKNDRRLIQKDEDAFRGVSALFEQLGAVRRGDVSPYRAATPDLIW